MIKFEGSDKGKLFSNQSFIFYELLQRTYGVHVELDCAYDEPKVITRITALGLAQEYTS